MGISVEQLEALHNELTKVAGFKSNLVGVGKRMLSPITGAKAGWKQMSPTKSMASGSERGADLYKTVKNRASQVAAGKEQGAGLGTKLKGFFAKNLGAGEHLIKAEDKLNRGVAGVAEKLSRSGWTGEGRLTKYMPVGEKGQTGMWGAMAVPSIARAAQGDPSEGGVLQHAGSGAGWAGGAVLGAGLGFPGMVAGVGAGMLGEHLGKKGDEAYLGYKTRRARELSERVARTTARRNSYGA